MTSFLARVAPKNIGWEPYVYLVFLGFMLMQPFMDESFGTLDWALTALLIAVFLPVYLSTFSCSNGRGRIGVGLVALLGFIGMFINFGSSSFFIYAAAGAAFVFKPRQAVTFIAAILGLEALAFAFSPVPLGARFWAFFPGIIFAPIIGGINIFEAEKERANTKLRLAQEEVEHLATIAERERIARDLHDLLGHTLSVITLKSELASKLVPSDPLRAEQEMAEVTRVSRQALREVREAVRGYRSRGLPGELTVAKEMLAAASVQFDYLAAPLELTPAQEGTLALALREAVTNVVRHAGASRCTVRLLHKGREVRLEVEDDGRGKQLRDGAGLSGMRERAEALGGSLNVESLRRGTRLVLTLPTERIGRAVPQGENVVAQPVAASPKLENA